MNLIPLTVSRGVATTALKLSASQPKLLFVGGVIGAVGATVLACRATLKLSDELDRLDNNVELLKQAASENEELAQDLSGDLYRTYAQGTFRIAKLYGPSILLGVASIAMLAKSHNMMEQRIAAASAAYAAVSEAFTAYRGRVVT